MPLAPFLRRWSLAATAALLALQLPVHAADDDATEATAAAKKPGAPKWDVNHPPGPKQTVDIDTRTGTWMTVDVSPDGKRLVFDLLGDLYTLPIEGGEAAPLTHSIAWEMQARWSPDGSRIAYVSDAGGGDNVWVMNADGSEPQAVTQEDFRLLYEPAWSPDGRYIAAHKHFTGTRSLGSGEIWLYHASGHGKGKGLQLNEKPNWQKDLGEPAFSPDGRYVYFSQDTTAGNTFEYNKDSNKEIFDIQRLRDATINGAHYLGMDRDIGSLEPGKLADLVIIDGDPVADIRQSDRIADVMLNGRLYALPHMDEIAPRALARRPFFFDGADGASMPVSAVGHELGEVQD